MAKVIESFPGKRKGKSKYSDLLDGRVWLLERGTDFNGAQRVVSVGMAIRTAAKRKKVTVHIHIESEDRLYVQAEVPTPEPEQL